MKTIHAGKLGRAFGLVAILFYFGCILLLAIAGSDGTAFFFNTLLHGLDVSSIMRPDVPWWEALIGIAETYLLAWIAGAGIASIYNYSVKNQ